MPCTFGAASAAPSWPLPLLTSRVDPPSEQVLAMLDAAAEATCIADMLPLLHAACSPLPLLEEPAPSSDGAASGEGSGSSERSHGSARRRESLPRLPRISAIERTYRIESTLSECEGLARGGRSPQPREPESSQRRESEALAAVLSPSGDPSERRAAVLANDIERELRAVALERNLLATPVGLAVPATPSHATPSQARELEHIASVLGALCVPGALCAPGGGARPPRTGTMHPLSRQLCLLERPQLLLACLRWTSANAFRQVREARHHISLTSPSCLP